MLCITIVCQKCMLSFKSYMFFMDFSLKIPLCIYFRDADTDKKKYGSL